MRLSTILVPFLLMQGMAIILWQVLGGLLILWSLAAWLGAAPAILAFAMIRSQRSAPPEISVAGSRSRQMRE
jgi:hypothetical protein